MVMDEINKKLVDKIVIGCKIETTAKVTILEAGSSPSSNETMFEMCQAYFNDLKINIKEEGHLDIWADQVIHQWLIKFNDDETNRQL